MGSSINPSLIRDKLIFYLDVQNSKSTFTEPASYFDLLQIDEEVNYETFYTDGVNTTFTFSPAVTSKFNNVTAGTKLIGWEDLSSTLAPFTVIDRSTITGNITGDNNFGYGSPYSINPGEGYIIVKSNLEYNGEPIGITTNSTTFNLTSFKDLIQGISLTSETPSLCASHPNRYLKFYKDKYATEQGNRIKNTFDQKNFTILLWVRNRDDNETYDKTAPIFGQIALSDQLARSFFLENADKEIKGINGLYNLQSTIPKPSYKNADNALVYWSDLEVSWNIGLTNDPEEAYYKSFENVDYPWQVSSWTALISSAVVTAAMPTLSVLNQNNIFRFTRFDQNSNKEYRTSSVQSDKITNVGGTWDIRYKNNFFNTIFYAGNDIASEPWEILSWSPRVSSLSAYSDIENNLAVNYLTLDNSSFRINSHGTKQIYRSENQFNDNRSSTVASNRLITHISQPRSLNLLGNIILPSLNRLYTQNNSSPPQFTSVNDRFIKATSEAPWVFQRRASGVAPWIIWYIGSDITHWPWQVTSWVSKVTGWGLVTTLSQINGNYYTDGEIIGGTSGDFNSQANLWNYISTDLTRRVLYREVAGGATSFSFDLNYPPLHRQTFERTELNSDGVSLYQYNTSPTSYYQILRQGGRWLVKSQTLTLYRSETIDNSINAPYDVSSWVTTVTALSTQGGGLKDLSGETFDSDAQGFFTRAALVSEEEKPYIDAFVRGCKDLGLWDVMVCWPMLSSQNAANTLNVYSLGGSGEYNGLMEGSNSEPAPTIQWTANGLRSPSVHNRISTTKQRFDYNQRTFYAAARSEVASYGSRARFIHSGWSEPTFLEYGPTTIRGMALNDSIAGHAQGGASIGNATYHIEGTDSARFSAFGINAAPPFNTLNTFATHTATLCSRALKVFRNGVVLNTGVAGINNQPPPGTNLGNPNPGGTWADSLSDGAYLHFMNSMEKGSPGGSFAGLIGTMAFAADFDIALSEQKLKSFDTLYRLTLGRNLPLPQLTLFNNSEYLLSDGTLYPDNNNKPSWEEDQSLKASVDSLRVVFAGDPDPLSEPTTWGGAPTAWYYGVYDASSSNPFNVTLAFSASNPEAENPWDVVEWIPLEAYSVYQAPTAVPIILQPPAPADINRFTGLSGWVIESTATGNALIASAANPIKVEYPWSPNVTDWVNTTTGATHNVTEGGLITETLTVTQNPEISAWYWQFGGSNTTAYSAQSIETFPWDVPYELWQPNPASPYASLPAPRLIRPSYLPITVEPFDDEAYLNIDFLVTPLDGGSLLKRSNGILGYKLENLEPRFAGSLGSLEPNSKEWNLVGLGVSGSSVKLYKNLNVQSYLETNTSFGLSSISIGASNVDIGQVLVYNKQLTDTEIIKNYRWFKGRYHKDVQFTGPITESRDPDALAYIEKNNITVLSAQKAISDFCGEMKANDLWDNIVCWPLRLSQMVPTGNTVYSLGGFGSYEGNIIGGSTRQEAGLRLTSTQYISTNSPGITGNNPRTLFVVTDSTNGVGFYCGEGRGSATVKHQAFTLKRRIDNIVFIDFWDSTSISLPTNKALGGSCINNTYTVWTPSNNVQGVNEFFAGTLPGNFYINQAHQDYQSERQTNNYAFVLKANTNFTKSQFDLVYSIYKRTLGQGLVLT